MSEFNEKFKYIDSNDKLRLSLIYDHHWNENIIPSEWEKLPFINFSKEYDKIVDKYKVKPDKYFIISSKVENTCKKILMMYFAANQALSCEEEFMSTQDRCNPCLIWDYEINYYAIWNQ